MRMDGFKVLGIELTDLYELIRFNLNVKQEKAGLISYKFNDGFHLGFYYPSFLKKTFLSFIYISIPNLPEKVYSYSNDSDGKEVIFPYPAESPAFINIPVAFLNESPHEFIALEDLEDSWEFIEVEDLRSLIILGATAYFETADIPYIWYDVEEKTYLLNIYSSGDGVDTNLYFYWKGNYKGPYIYISRDFREMGYSRNIRDVSRNYFLVIKARNLPYLLLKDLAR